MLTGVYNGARVMCVIIYAYGVGFGVVCSGLRQCESLR